MNPEQVPHHLLTVLLLIPLLGTFAIGLLPATSARNVALLLGIAMVAVSAMLGFYLDPNVVGMQFVEQVPWIRFPFQADYHVGMDGLSYCLVALTTVVTLAAIIASKGVAEFRPKLYYSMLMLLTSSILGVFISLDLIQFFVFWELELAPMYFLIAIWGGPRRDYAAMKFLIYTFFGGIFMFAGILYLYLNLAPLGAGMQTFDMVKLAQLAPSLPATMQAIACLGFMLAFLIKLPSFPFHTWLPDAHVEAPTPVSMILAGLLLKMGSYGLVRICLGFFPEAINSFAPYLIALGCFNIVWAAIACLVQDDMKRIIAFSSVSHMGFVTLGIASMSAAALNGAIFQMIGHGVISAALFFLVGVIYDRCHTRSLAELGGGFAGPMPQAYYFWMLAVMANLGLPGLAGFVAEVTTFYGAYTSPMAHGSEWGDWTRIWIVVACTGVILTAGYMLWLFKRLFYGPILDKWAGHISDMNSREILTGAILAVFIIALGVYPMMVTDRYTKIADSMAAEVVKHARVKDVGALPGADVH